MVELDLHRSRDGHLVVIHDGRVDATTDGHGEVAALTLAELRRLDAGRGERIPTFEEVLELAHEGCGLYVELKAREPPRRPSMPSAATGSERR